MKRNTDAIVQLAAEKSRSARQRVLVALQELQQTGKPITFTLVGQSAHVSKTFLYDPRQADLATEIRRLRDLPSSHGKERHTVPYGEKVILPKMLKLLASKSGCAYWNVKDSACARKMHCSMDEAHPHIK